MTISRILVPMDFSDDSEAALRFARDLARRYDATIHLLHVVENPLATGVWSAELYTSEIAGLQLNLVRDAKARLEKSVPEGTAMSTEVRVGKAANEILNVARERGVDLIVMGTHGRTGLALLILGSVAERVVRMAPCPVLTVRASYETASSESSEKEKKEKA